MIYPITRQDELRFFRGVRNALAMCLPLDGLIVWLIWRVL